MLTNDKIGRELEAVLTLFESGQLPDLAARATFAKTGNWPSDKWSLSNQLIMLLHHTDDARGFRQWKQAGRHVKKGSKAFYILGPTVKKIKDTDAEGNERESQRLVGFHAIAVFRYEDTDGAELPDHNITLPPLPLLDVADALGYSVRAERFDGSTLGCHSATLKEIRLASPAEDVFLHELAHAAHTSWAGPNDSGKQDPKREIVAELCAATLARTVGRRTANEGNAYKYIEHYAEALSKDVHRACLSVLKDVQKTLAVIVATAANVQGAKAAA